MELRNQVAKSGVHVDVDAPKGQDLSQIMAEIRAKYESMAKKNQEELKAWHESQVSGYMWLSARSPDVSNAMNNVDPLFR